MNKFYFIRKCFYKKNREGRSVKYIRYVLRSIHMNHVAKALQLNKFCVIAFVTASYCLYKPLSSLTLMEAPLSLSISALMM